MLFTARTPSLRNPAATSIAVLEKMTLGGVEQWVCIRGQDIRNPILVHLHGGPGGGMDVAPLRKKHPRLEQAYTVVTWNQRGAGKSYSPNLPVEALTVEQMVADAEELVRTVCARLGQSKVYLMAHSIGTVFGLMLAQRHPELLHAYLGINQVVNREEEERFSFQTALERAQQRGDRKAVADLTRVGPPQQGRYKSVEDLVTQRSWLTRLGGVTVKPMDATRWHLTNFLSAEYSLADLLRVPKGLKLSMERLWPELLTCNFMASVAEVQVPVFLCVGRHDGITNVELMQRFLAQLKAPRKELWVLEQSGHVPFMEEPQAFDDRVLGMVKSMTG